MRVDQGRARGTKLALYLARECGRGSYDLVEENDLLGGEVREV